MRKGPKLFVSGYDSKGNSVWTSERALDLAPPKGGIKTDPMWQISKVPVPMDESGVLTPGLLWPQNGINFRYVIFPPKAKKATPGKSPRSGVHETDTVDFLVMVSGEIYVGLEGTKKEIVMKPGDVLIQRGTTHYWNNKGNKPAIFAVVIIDSTRSVKTPRTKSGARSTTAAMAAQQAAKAAK